MPANVSLLVELGIIAGSALALSLAAWALRLPAALGQLLAGIVIGPFGLKLVTDLTIVEAMAEVGIVLLLFIVGLELDPLELITAGPRVIIFSLVELGISFAAGFLAGLLLGWTTLESILLAGAVGISSTALVVSMLYERGIIAENSARVMIGALILEDIVAVLILSLVPGMAAGGVLSLSDAGSWIARGVLLVLLILVSGLYLAPRVIDRISQLEFDIEQAGFLLSLSLGFAMAILSSTLGFPAATGAFLMGLFIRGKRARFVYGKIRPVRDLFLIVFFVSMGMLIDPSQFLNPGLILPVVGLALVGKFIGSWLGAFASGLGRKASLVAIEMMPRGEFSFIIAREASLVGIARQLIYPIAGSVVLVTTLVSAVAQVPRGLGWRRILSK